MRGLLSCLVVLVAASCSSTSEPVATGVVAVEPTATQVPTNPPMPTVRPTPTAAPTPTIEPTVAPTPRPRPTLAPTPTVEPTPTAAPTAAAPAAASTPPASTAESPVPGPDKTLVPVDYDGPVRAIRTASGLMLAVRGVEAGTYTVVTPCYEIATTTAGLPITGPIDVLIDPGHGGFETGAVGPNGLKESTINLRVAELTKAALEELGYRVELTRYADHRVAIQSRTELANSLAPRVFLSIHHNGGFPVPIDRAGTEVFVQLGDSESQRLGGLVFEELSAAFADIDIEWMGNLESLGVAWRKNRAGTDLYGILRRTPGLVTVLSEAMFLSTPAEAALLAQPQTAVTEAEALATAVDRWFTTQEPGSGFIDGIVFQGDLGNGGGTEGCVDPPLG